METSRKRLRKCSRKLHTDTVPEDGPSRKRLRKCSRKVHTDTVQEDGPSRKRLRKCSRKVQEDGPFSWLPDEIIVSHILPRLTLQEAVRCSVLSRRWEKLWTHIIGPKLLFSRSFAREFKEGIVDNCLVSKLAPNFANWITRVMKTYSKPTLEELIVRYGFDSSCSESLDGWVEYALRRGVTRLELDLSPWTYSASIKQYAFPSVKILSSLHPLCDYRLCEPVRCSGFCNLRDICLKHVNVPVKVIKFMLSKCPLERFCLWNSRGVGSVKVSEKLLKLKILEFVDCFGLDIDISATNLVSLNYGGSARALKTKPLPHLLELSIGGSCCSLFMRTGAKNFRRISQIRRLSLSMPRETIGEKFCNPLEFPTFVNLEWLELTMFSVGDVCQLWPIFLIKTAPRLRSLSIKSTSLGRSESSPQQDWSYIRNATKRVKHPSLEVIELHKFVGLPCQLELGRALIDVSPSLKQLKFVPAIPPCEYTSWPFETYREHAEEFRRWIPNGVDFVVL